jgi:hypothetical protein
LYNAGTGALAGWTLNNRTWSSTDFGAGFHYRVDLDNGYVGWDFDSASHYVSCVH